MGGRERGRKRERKGEREEGRESEHLAHLSLGAQLLRQHHLERPELLELQILPIYIYIYIYIYIVHLA